MLDIYLVLNNCMYTEKGKSFHRDIVLNKQTTLIAVLCRITPLFNTRNRIFFLPLGHYTTITSQLCMAKT